MKTANKLCQQVLVFLILSLLCSAPAWAGGTGGGDDLGMGELLDWLVGLIEGVVGKTLAIVAFLAGGVGAVVKGNLWFLGIGIAFAVVFYYGPSIILNVFGAGVPLV